MKRYKIALLVLIVVGLVKLIKINSGLISPEPDEANYLEVLRSLRSSIYPTYFGIPFFYTPPLYPLLALVFSFFTRDDFLSLRLVSLTVSILTSITIYFYLKSKINSMVGFLAGLLYALIPLSLYYSRVGVIESSLAFFSFLFLALFDSALSTGKVKIYLLAGFTLALAILSKLTALILITVPLSSLVIEAMKPFKLKSSAFLSLLPLIIGLGLTVLVGFVYYSHEPTFFKEQLKYILGFSSKRADLISIILDSPKFDRFFSAPVIIFAFLGLLANLRNKKIFYLIFSAVFLSIVVLGNPLSIGSVRYYPILVPWMASLCAVGVWTTLKTSFPLKRFLIPVCLVVSTFLLLSKSVLAFQGSDHSIIKEAGLYLKENFPDNWIYYNYWPTLFVTYSQNYKATWLTKNEFDAAAFANQKGSRFVRPLRDSGSILEKMGGVVVIEKPFSDWVNTNHGRKELAAQVEKKAQKLTELRDKNTFFPYPQIGESVTIYSVSRGDLKDE